MSSSPPGARPRSVTIVAVLAALLALADIVSGVVVVLGAPSADPLGGMTQEQSVLTLRVVGGWFIALGVAPVSYTHLRAHETVLDLVCRLLLEKKLNSQYNNYIHRMSQ